MMLLKRLSIITLIVLFSLIFIGGYVSASGVGLSCPKWPLCPAGLIPMQEFIIEYFHRTVAATTGVLVFATMIFTLKSKVTSKNAKIASVIGVGLVIGQIALGAIVIVEKSPCSVSHSSSWDGIGSVCYGTNCGKECI